MTRDGLFRVRPDAGEPIYQQLMRQIKHAIVGGVLQEGDQLPTVRDMAQQLVVNPNTISRTYRELESEGLIESTQGRGTFVRHRPLRFVRGERLKRLQPFVEQLIAEGLALGFSIDDLRREVDVQLRAFPIRAEGVARR